MGSLKATKHLLKNATSWWVLWHFLWMTSECSTSQKTEPEIFFVEITAPSNRGVHAFKQISTAYKWFARYEMYWQRAVYFPLFDHLLQERNDRLRSQENCFIGQYLVPAKLNALNSGVQDKLYGTHKTDLSEKRDFDNEILRWQTKWSHSTDEKPVTHLTETVSSLLIQTFIPRRSQLLTSSWQCHCQLPPLNDLLARCAEWRRTYVPRWKQSHLPWCMLTGTYPLICRSRDSRILCPISLSSIKISDMCATNVSLVRSLHCCCCSPQPQLAVLVQYGILAFAN